MYVHYVQIIVQVVKQVYIYTKIHAYQIALLGHIMSMEFVINVIYNVIHAKMNLINVNNVQVLLDIIHLFVNVK